MKKLIGVVVLSCCLSYNLWAQQLELLSATRQQWDYTPGTSHGPGPFAIGMKYRFNFHCDDFNSIVLDSIFLGSDKTSLCYGNSSTTLDTQHHIYSLFYTGRLYMKNIPNDDPVIITYKYKGIKYSRLVTDFTNLPPSSAYKCGVR